MKSCGVWMGVSLRRVCMSSECVWEEEREKECGCVCVQTTKAKELRRPPSPLTALHYSEEQS